MEFFIDSSVLTEALKKDGKKEASELWEEVVKFLADYRIEFFVNIIVYSETIFKLIIKGKKKPLLLDEYIYKIFKVLSWLNSDYQVKELTEEYIKTYKLFTNDAIILATCKYYGIKYLISIDSDFPIPCEKEEIILINSPEKLKEILLS